MKVENLRAAILTVVVGAFASCLPAVGMAKPAPAPALFQVGAAAIDVTPTTPLYIGGYGNETLVSDSHDPLEVARLRRSPRATRRSPS